MRIISIGESPLKELTELEKAKAEMSFQRKSGGFGYKQAKARYEAYIGYCYGKKIALDAVILVFYVYLCRCYGVVIGAVGKKPARAMPEKNSYARIQECSIRGRFP